MKNICLSCSSVVTCEIPEKLTKGKSSWDSQDEPMYGDIIEYVCEDGYALIGKNNTKCSETGEYDSPPPTCEGKDNPFMWMWTTQVVLHVLTHCLNKSIYIRSPHFQTIQYICR